MDNKKTPVKFNKVYNLLLNQKIAESIIILKEIIKEDKSAENKNELEKHTETYKYLLEYYKQGIEDPYRKKIHSDILKSLFDLTDKIRESILAQNLSLKTYEWKRRKEKYSLKIINKTNKLINTKSDLEDDNQMKSRLQITRDIFISLWFTDKYTESESISAKEFFLSENIYWDEKALAVSAINLSLFKSFDARKIDLLFDIFQENEDRIWQRALVGLIISLYIHEDRIQFYPELSKKINNISEISKAEEKIEHVILQLIKTKETEDIIKKFREEILPEVIKFQPKINSKLDLDEIISESLIEDENPDWEKIFGEDSAGFVNKMEEFSMMQMEGADVLMSAFSQLKDFNFFYDLINWFTPFYQENLEIKKVFKNHVEGTVKEFDSDKFLEQLETSSYMCNSDKYSFCLNLERMPAQEKNMVLNLFNMQIDSISEVDETDNLSDELGGEQQIITQYIQDLYRFFKLYKDKKEFADIFSLKLDIYKKDFYKKVIKNDYSIQNIAELYFEKKYYDDAIEAFKKILESGESESVFYEKIGYSYQRLLDYENALDYYHKAELFDVNTKWINKKIAFCNLKLNNYQKALEHYQKVEKEDPEDLHTQTNIGHCYLHMKNYEEALKYYFKVEFFAPSNIKVMRPIAWCSLIEGKIEQAIKYYTKLLEKEATKYDYMNLGHSYFCKNDKLNAIKYYRKSLEIFKNNSKFVTEFEEDQHYIQKHGIIEFDIKLMLDLILTI